jgi:glycosyltransferase involved in cell wall biosynthesis
MTPDPRESVTLVVPCFDEAGRLDRAAFLSLCALRPEVRLLFVDDGSSDGTPAVLADLRAAASPGAIEVLRLPENRGKAEAVRHGLVAALASGAPVVGYVDADLATPPEEVVRLVDELRATPAAVLMGARVRLMGTSIDRNMLRHYFGRVYATFASLGLGIAVYDTQCGAKLFRRTEALGAALARPFRSRWGFDVELLERLLVGAPGARPVEPREIREVPLRVWRDVAGSKLGTGAMLGAGLHVLGLFLRSLSRRLRRRRAD